MQLERSVGPLTFENPLLYGGGTLKTLKDVGEACRSAAGGMELGSITPDMKPGNEGKTFYSHYEKGVLIYTLNSLGLTNPGKENVSSWAEEAIKRAHGAGKNIGMNVTADTRKEIVEMVLWAIELRFDWVTINIGCPNKFDKHGKPCAILTFDFDDLKQLLELLDKRVGCDSGEVWIKPSPFTDTLVQLPRFTGLVAASSVISGVIATNTVPHAFATDPGDGLPAISPGGGLAGMGGPAVKPIALGHLKMLDLHLSEHIHLIGSGGITYGQDLADHLETGAVLGQFTSAFWANNLDHNTAGNILGGFAEIKGIQFD